MCALSACPRILLTIVFPTYEKLEDGNVKLQSRLEQEEEAKAALLARIQRLTKLILVSTKATPTSRFSPHPGPRRRHSFGEEEVCLYIHLRNDDGEHSTNFCIQFSLSMPYQCFCIKHRVTKVCLLILQLAYLPYRRRDIMMDNESNELLLPVEGFGVSLEDSSKEEKKNRKGLLNWFKLRVCQLCTTLQLVCMSILHRRNFLAAP